MSVRKFCVYHSEANDFVSEFFTLHEAEVFRDKYIEKVVSRWETRGFESETEAFEVMNEILEIHIHWI